MSRPTNKLVQSREVRDETNPLSVRLQDEENQVVGLSTGVITFRSISSLKVFSDSGS